MFLVNTHKMLVLSIVMLVFGGVPEKSVGDIWIGNCGDVQIISVSKWLATPIY